MEIKIKSKLTMINCYVHELINIKQTHREVYHVSDDN